MDKKPPQSVSAADFELERLYDVHEVASKCRVSEKSLHKMARNGSIPAIKFGKLWRFRKSTIEAWLDSKTAS